MINDAINCPIKPILFFTSGEGYRFSADEAHASEYGIVINGKVIGWSAIEFCKNVVDQRLERAAHG